MVTMSMTMMMMVIVGMMMIFSLSHSFSILLDWLCMLVSCAHLLLTSLLPIAMMMIIVVSPVSRHFPYSRDFVDFPVSRHFPYSRDFVVFPVSRHFPYSRHNKSDYFWSYNNFSFELSASDAKQGVRSFPIKTVPIYQCTILTLIFFFIFWRPNIRGGPRGLASYDRILTLRVYFYPPWKLEMNADKFFLQSNPIRP